MRWLASALAVCVLGSAAASAQAPVVDAEARAAIVESVRVLLGAESEVNVTDLEVRLSAELPETIVATPAAGARLGRRVRFSLFESADGTKATRGRRVGYALATVAAAAPHLRVIRSVSRGKTLGPADVAESIEALGQQSMSELPSLVEAVGARARRNLSEGDVVTFTVLSIVPPVRSGDLVVVQTVVGNVSAWVTAVASQSGEVGKTILLVNKETGRRLKGRITGPQTAEVVNDIFR
jgi:flagella basal body P-ring formation protein FlgA